MKLIRGYNRLPKGIMWSAVPVALLCMVVNRNERQGSGPKGDKVLQNTEDFCLFVRPFVRLSPQALSGLKFALSGLKPVLSGQNLPSQAWNLRGQISGLRGQISGLRGSGGDE